MQNTSRLYLVFLIEHLIYFPILLQGLSLGILRIVHIFVDTTTISNKTIHHRGCKPQAFVTVSSLGVQNILGCIPRSQKMKETLVNYLLGIRSSTLRTVHLNYNCYFIVVINCRENVLECQSCYFLSMILSELPYACFLGWKISILVIYPSYGHSEE